MFTPDAELDFSHFLKTPEEAKYFPGTMLTEVAMLKERVLYLKQTFKQITNLLGLINDSYYSDHSSGVRTLGGILKTFTEEYKAYKAFTITFTKTNASQGKLIPYHEEDDVSGKLNV